MEQAAPLPSIHLASPDEIETIRQLADRTWRACYPGIIGEEQIDYMLGWMYSPDRIRSEMESGSIRYLLAEIPGGNPVGFAAFGPEESHPEEAFLHKLYVLPECQRLGCGSRLLDEVMRRSRVDGCRTLSLRVNRANHNAIRAYEKNGFRKTGEVCSEIGGGFVMDDYLMTRPLSS